MLNLFYNINKASSIVTNPSLDRTMFNFANEFNKLKTYYSNSNRIIKRPNRFISLVESMSIDIYNDDEDKIRLDLEDNASYIGRNFNICSSSNKSNLVTKGIVNNATEAYILKELNIEPFYALDYLNQETIKCVYHNSLDYSMHHPTMFKGLEEEFNLFMYEVDIVGLGMQYYYWARDALANDRDIDVARFLYTVVFVNLMDSIMNINLFNIFLELYKGNSLPPYVYKNPEVHIDYRDKIIKQYKYLIKDLKSKNKIDYDQFLHSIVLKDNNAYDLLKLNNYLFTTNNKWFLWLARINYIETIINLLGENSKKLNKDYISNLKIEIKLNMRNKSFKVIKDNIFFYLPFEQTLKNLKTI